LSGFLPLSALFQLISTLKILSLFARRGRHETYQQ
jgi:hypothetical protein